jgi:hypothetical protein
MKTNSCKGMACAWSIFRDLLAFLFSFGFLESAPEWTSASRHYQILFIFVQQFTW